MNDTTTNSHLDPDHRPSASVVQVRDGSVRATRPGSRLRALLHTPGPGVFPYRRSSDLRPERANAITEMRIAVPERMAQRHERSMNWKFIERSWRWAILRSEEHTSELQSRVDLVCRLPLEKKK